MKSLFTKLHKCFASLGGASGQAMVEYVILLTIIMLLCAGMMYSSRLLTFEFWAQQEARYIAFEQTWVPQMYRYNEDGNLIDDPVGELADGSFVHRPEVVDRLDAEKTISSDDGVTELISDAYVSVDPVNENTEINKITSSPVMFAKNDEPWYLRKTSAWFERSTSGWIDHAFAGEQLPANLRRNRSPSLIPRSRTQDPRPASAIEADLGQKFSVILDRTGFGESFCNRATRYLTSKNFPAGASFFAMDGCAERYNRDFGLFLAENLDGQEFFRDYEYQLQDGFSNAEALEITLQQVIATQFYSFFDTLVKAAFITTVPWILAERLDYSGEMGDASIGRMVGDLRFIGSSAAIGSIILAFGTLSLQDPFNQSAGIDKTLEDTLVDILHTDASTLLGGVGNGFLLNPTYLPVPPTFGPLAGGLFSGPMRAVLNKEPHLIPQLIEESNKLAKVDYHAELGIFPGARRRWDPTGKVLTSRFYLVTQPWHIPRRMNRTGDYRQKGTQDDDLDEETDEAMLRRRVHGLWLIPTPVSSFLEPILGAVSGAADLGPLFDTLEVIEAPIGLIKDLISDNPLLDFVNAVADLPIIGELVPTLPRWPAVRPDAYPHSTEMVNDQLSGKSRKFEDFVTEQRNNNPDPDPEYN